MKKNGGVKMENKNYSNQIIDEVVFSEISVVEMEALEETVTPGFGLICGNSCWGLGCF